MNSTAATRPQVSGRKDKARTNAKSPVAMLTGSSPEDDHDGTDPTWSLHALRNAITDADRDSSFTVGSVARFAQSHQDQHQSDPPPRGRKRRARGRAWTVGSAPESFAATSTSHPPRLNDDEDDERPELGPELDEDGKRRQLPRAFSPRRKTFARHALCVDLPAAHNAHRASGSFRVVPSRSSPALLASPIRLASGSKRSIISNLGPTAKSTRVAGSYRRALAGAHRRGAASAHSQDAPRNVVPPFAPLFTLPAIGHHSRLSRSKATHSLAGVATSQSGCSSNAEVSPGSHPSPPPASSPESAGSPGSWLSPIRDRSLQRLRSAESSADAIMFTPRQLTFEGDGDAVHGQKGGRRLDFEFDGFETDGLLPVSSPPPSFNSTRSLGPAFAPNVCVRERSLSPAFGLETDPELGVS